MRPGENEEEREDGDDEHNGEVHAAHAEGGGEGADAGGDADDGEHIKKVAADEIPQGDVAATIEDGHDGCGELWQAGAEGDEAEPDYELADAEVGGDEGG